MRPASQIPPQLPSWLWENRIPRGAITLIVGSGGVGKSTEAVALAARLSLGGLTGQPEDSLLALQEDDEAAVSVPRLMVAGADLTRVHLEGNPCWRLPGDLRRVDQRVAESKATLVVIDPLDASVPALASHAARATLDDLAAIAHSRGAAVVCLHHLIKSGSTIAQRIGGGRAVQAVARSILVLYALDRIAKLVLDLPSNVDILALEHFKSSYGPKAPTLLLERLTEPHPIQGGGTVARLVEYAELTEGEDTDLVSPDRSRDWRRRVARTLIERFLLHGPCTAEDLAADVMAAEVSRETFERARAELAKEGVIEQFQRDGRHWWRLALPDRLPDGLD